MISRFSIIVILGSCLAGICGISPASLHAQPASPAALFVTKAAAPAFLAETASKPSNHTDLFDWINFILLVVVLVYVLRKPVGQFFENRSAALRRDLEEGRKALETARAELARAEQMMTNLEADIAALKVSAAREGDLELARLRQASEEEASRMMESARHMIDSATQAARLELRRTAASEAIGLAEKMIRARLDDDGRRRLVNRFLEGIGKSQKPGKSV